MAYNFTELDKVVSKWAEGPTRYNFHEPTPNNITLFTGGAEMLKIGEDGFYVRGVKVPADDQEAATVYNAFKEFLVWSRLHRD